MRLCLGLLLLTCAAAGAQDLNTLLESKVNPDDYAIKQDEFGLRAPNPIQNLDARFRPDGVALAPHKWDDALKTGALVRLRTASWGRAEHMRTLEDTPPIAVGVAQPPSAVRSDVGQPSSAVPVSSCTAEGGCATSRVEYHHPGLTEWYLNGASGLEQGFTIADRPAGTGELRVHVQVGAARAVSNPLPTVGEGGPKGQVRGAVRLVSDSGRALSFGKLVVKDAAGRTLPSHFELLSLHTLGLVVDDRDAQYPIVVDPTVADDHWQAGFNLPGFNNYVNALAVDATGNVYAGGGFVSIGEVSADYVAKWTRTTSSWSTLGTGMNRPINALAVDGSGNVYAGGDFTTAGGVSASHLAKWTPATSTWSALGTGMNGRVSAIAMEGGGSVYAGGGFTTAGGVNANYIAKWTPATSTWSALGTGMDGGVNALAVDGGGNVYAGGLFHTAGVVSAIFVAKWNGSVWSALGTGMNAGPVNALAVDGSGNVYAGGHFTAAGGVGAWNIAKWTPATSTWSALGTGLNNDVDALAVDGSGNVYAGGYFTTAGGVSAKKIAKWTPATSTWSALGTGMDAGFVYALAMDGSETLYAGGQFTTAGDVYARHIAKWTPAVSTWSALGAGMDNWVYAIALDGSGNVYAGGAFTYAGGVTANSIAKWTPATSTWSALGTGMGGINNPCVYALTVDGSGDVYAGGDFPTAGGVTANYIAKWTPATSTWSALGTGMSGYVLALAVDGSGSVYAGGRFTTAGGVGANYISKWTPATSTWSALGIGMYNGDFYNPPRVYALAVDGSGNVYAGGNFTMAGGVAAHGIAKWDGSGWSALGTGVGGVLALAVDGIGNVYAGGFFTTAGGVGANYIAKWTPVMSTWSALGTGMGGSAGAPYVYTLAVDGSGNVYAGGDFTVAGGVSANYIAKWTPATSTWSALGTGMGGDLVAPHVYALAADDSGNNVYAGGDFYLAGGKASTRFAHFYNRPPVNTVSPAVTGSHLVSETLTANPGMWSEPDADTVTVSYQWERANDGAGGGAAPIAGATNSTYALGTGDDLRYVRATVIADDGASGIALGSSPWKLVGGYEADVAPCVCGGDADVSIADWVQVGRFAAALDAVTAGSEFQKADCAPKETNGDGAVSIADWVQAGRYAAKLDPVQTVGGPSAP